MTNEDKILALLMNMQKNIVEIKQDVADLKQDVAELKQEQQLTNERLGKLEANFVELNKNQQVMQDDLSFLVKKTLDNCTDIRKLKLVK